MTTYWSKIAEKTQPTLIVAEMVPSFLYPLSLTIADYRGLSLTIAAKRSAAQRSAAVVEIGLYPQRPGSIADQSRSHMDDVDTLVNFSMNHTSPETRVMGLSDGVHSTILLSLC